jgi:hypothetical protein
MGVERMDVVILIVVMVRSIQRKSNVVVVSVFLELRDEWQVVSTVDV